MAQPPYDPYGSNPENAEGNAAFGQDSGSPYEQPQEPAAPPAPEAAPASQPTDAGQTAAHDPYSQPAAESQAQQSSYSQQAAPSQPGAGYPGQDQQSAYGQPGTHQAGYGQPGPGAGAPGAPYGYDPVSGLPYSEKSKLVAGLLGILLGGFGVGRFYTGHIGLGVAQLIVTFVTFGLGSLWGLIDGIMMLAGNAKDSNGLPLRPN